MSPASSDSDQPGASNPSRIESLQQRLAPILANSPSPNQNRNNENSPNRPTLSKINYVIFYVMTIFEYLATGGTGLSPRRPASNLPIQQVPVTTNTER